MNLIVAVDSNWGIGLRGTQTVVIPEDRKMFRTLTDGDTVIVGHRTLLDFPGGKPLAGRKNIVLSRHTGLKIDGAVVVNSLGGLFREIANDNPDRVFVIGGDKIFRLLLPYCRTAYVTRIDAAPENDAYFPNLDTLESWELEERGETKTHDGVDYAFLKYRNTSPLAPIENEE